MVRFTPNGLSVRSRQRAISLVRSSGVGWGSAVIRPSAPALAAAATNSARPTHCMPPWTIGCSTPTSSVNRVLIMLALCFPAVSVVRNTAHPLFSGNRMPSGPTKVYRAGAVKPMRKCGEREPRSGCAFDQTQRARSGGAGGRFRGRRLVVERARDVAHADDADQAVIVDHGQMADVLGVHDVTDLLERIGRGARHQLLHRDQFRDLEIGAGRAMFGDGANHVAFREHADC